MNVKEAKLPVVCGVIKRNVLAKTAFIGTPAATETE